MATPAVKEYLGVATGPPASALELDDRADISTDAGADPDEGGDEDEFG